MEFIRHRRSLGAIKGFAQRLGCTYEEWTEEELAWLANNATASKQELCEYLTRHSWIAIRGTAERLLDLDVRAKASAMPEQDLKVLKLHYEELGPDDILPLLSQHYKRSSVMNAANKLGLHWNSRKIHMLEEELDLIRTYYPTEGREGLFKRFNEKYSKVFIARTAKALGVQYKRLVQSELEAFIKDNYLVKTSEQMATELKVSTGTISTVMKRLNLLSPHTNKNRVKKVRCVETNQVYTTVHQAVVATGITSISYGLKNNKPAGGYHWEYVE